MDIIKKTYPLVSTSDFKTIYHISDIHIRLLKRHKEYITVFNNLYSYISKDTNNAMIVVTGDIVHAKLEMSPELVKLTSDFLTSLSKLCPTVLITGNHDLNVNNFNRLDVLSPIVENLDTTNLFYLRETGIYTFNNIDFAVFSIFDSNPFELISAKDCTNKINIALYHESIQNSSTEANHKMEQIHNNISNHSFIGFDYVMLGHIHKRQLIQKFHAKNNIKYPSIAYASSLIQQDHTEIYNEHGLIKWDLKNYGYEFVSIENDYGYHTIEIEKGEIVSVPKETAKYPKIRLDVRNTKLTELKSLEAEIKSKYKVNELSIVTSNIINDESQNISDTINVLELTNVSKQNELIINFVDNKYPELDVDVLQEVLDINKAINIELNTSNQNANNTIILKELWFDNLFNFGEGNYIDFSNLNNIIGLFAKNAHGKSSIVQILLFTLFDRTTKVNKALHILNIDKDEFFSKVKFSINDVDYFIEKRGERGNFNYKPAVKVHTQFYYIDENGDEQYLNGDQRRDTNSIIKSYISDINNATLTSFSLQGNNAGFILKNQSERKTLLSHLLGIDIFEQLFNIANQQCKEEQTLLKQFSKDRTFELYYQLKNEKVIFEETYEKNQIIHENKKQELIVLNENKLELISKIKHVDEELDIDKLNSSKKSIETQLSKANKQLTDKQDELSKFGVKVSDLNTKIAEYDEDEINKFIIQYKKINIEFNKLKTKLISDLKELEFKEQKMHKLQHLEYDKDCKFCMNNIFVKDAIETKNVFDTDKTKYDNDVIILTELNNKNNDLKIYPEKLNELNNLIKEKEKLKVEYKHGMTFIENTETSIKLFNDKLKDITDKIIKFYNNQEIIENNKTINLQIKEVSKNIQLLESEITKSNKILQNNYSDLNQCITKIEDIEYEIETIKKHEKSLEAYQIYLDAINKDGIPYLLIKQIIPLFELEVNNILEQLAEFTLKFEVDDKNIDIDIVYKNRFKNSSWSLDLSSGMELFISSIAIRVALAKISNQSKFNFLIVDEGFDVLDNENKQKLEDLFVFLSEYFDFILIISHLDIMRDIVTDSITIEQDSDNYSKINFIN